VLQRPGALKADPTLTEIGSAEKEGLLQQNQEKRRIVVIWGLLHGVQILRLTEA